MESPGYAPSGAQEGSRGCRTYDPSHYLSPTQRPGPISGVGATYLEQLDWVHATLPAYQAVGANLGNRITFEAVV